MIVGCAGAGKTTLLKRLLGCCEEEIKEVKSTEGLEVHEEIFELCEETKSLEVRYMDQRTKEENATYFNTKTLTFFDFGGQSAYYACHQIYLTRRAFYVVVVDASKRLDQVVDQKVCDQVDSVFAGWTYGDYFVFWIKSIHTYCGSDNEREPMPIVLIVATHWEDKERMFETKDDLIKSLKRQLPKSSYLSQYVREDNCYCTQLCLPLDEVKDCFFYIANQSRWEENIPKEWFFFGIEINQKKHSERILKIWDIKTKVPEITPKGQKNSNKVEKETKDMLRYYHDAGKALYFPEHDLENKVIIDVQWFIDAFKHIITDELHFKDIPVSWEDWVEFYKTGHLQDKLLTDLWKHKDEELLECSEKGDKNYDITDVPYGEDHRYLQYHRKSLLMFMQRLGLLVVGKEYHYVPCMNRKELEEKLLNLMNNSYSKSSVLIYRFEFLPFFLFFRLVVACMQVDGWNVLRSDDTSCLYRNAAFFSYMEYNIVLSVTEESIQIQVFSPMQGYDLEKVKIYSIQESVEEILNDFARSFHRKIMFVRGFRCRMDKGKTIAIDIKEHFLPQKDIPKKDGKMICPLHPFDHHIINTAELTQYWKVLE
ncbi:probable serine/threonine-protein kinase pats1 [Saccostrea cucullata]|uniref:probable serine/threonine-protein kinase pats1 n=1 Tax=Saccostrea cuccullata TaxID=36930 RepID=UPI002ED1249C